MKIIDLILSAGPRQSKINHDESLAILIKLAVEANIDENGQISRGDAMLLRLVTALREKHSTRG